MWELAPSSLLLRHVSHPPPLSFASLRSLVVHAEMQQGKVGNHATSFEATSYAWANNVMSVSIDFQANSMPKPATPSQHFLS